MYFYIIDYLILFVATSPPPPVPSRVRQPSLPPSRPLPALVQEEEDVDTISMSLTDCGWYWQDISR